MSTRAVYTFKDDRDTHHVYVHHDGYPSGAFEKIQKAADSRLVWQLPRFEADEFASGFVAVNKEGSGSVRLTAGPDSHGDLEYRYEITCEKGMIHVTAFELNGPEQQIYKGTLRGFGEFIKREETA